MKLKDLIISSYIPREECEKVKKRAVWDDRHEVSIPHIKPPAPQTQTTCYIPSSVTPKVTLTMIIVLKIGIVPLSLTCLRLIDSLNCRAYFVLTRGLVRSRCGRWSGSPERQPPN